VKTKKFPAKSSSERSYAHFLPQPAAFGWKAERRELARTMIEKRAPESLCDEGDK
jgi:hypothetical protein